jgi:hypothetical protein
VPADIILTPIITEGEGTGSLSYSVTIPEQAVGSLFLISMGTEDRPNTEDLPEKPGNSRIVGLVTAPLCSLNIVLGVQIIRLLATLRHHCTLSK